MNRKSSALSITVILLVTGIAGAAISIPPMINYQGKLTDRAGSPISGNRDMTFKLYAESLGGAAVWSETQAGVLIISGLFNVQLGSVTPISALPDGPSCYLEITVAGELVSPRVRIVSAAYAAKAAQAEDASNLGGVPAANHIRSGTAAGGDLSGTYPSPQIATGAVVNSDISASAGIVDTKLAGTGTLVNNLNSDLLDGLHSSQMGGAQLHQVVRGLSEGNMMTVDTQNLTATIDPARSVVSLYGAYIASGTYNMGSGPHFYLAGLTATQIFIGYGYNWNGNSGNVRARVSYQIVEYQ